MGRMKRLGESVLSPQGPAPREEQRRHEELVSQCPVRGPFPDHAHIPSPLRGAALQGVGVSQAP